MNFVNKNRSLIASLRRGSVKFAIDALRTAVHCFFAVSDGCCRFTPCCSMYAKQVIGRHGVGRGIYLTVRRLLRCTFFGGYGLDPAPPSSNIGSL